MIFSLIAIAIGISVWYFFNSSKTDTRTSKTEMSVTTNDLLKDFDYNSSPYDQTPYSDYIEKAIEIEGVIDTATIKNGTYTLLLKGDKIDTFVLCEMQKDQEQHVRALAHGDQVKVKGIFKGFLKDAILLNCIILKEEVYE